uniref:Transmembrane protein 33 n=1 Tax=Schmidtea mediterranea TaxID=79327 RepID=A0A023ZRP0_SCHMD|nr:transmembrane protein 33 [Schmidtea mediterranea]
MASVGTSALRLFEAIQTENQPMGFNRATLTSLLSKDSCHYLIFSVMFLSASPVTISIIPILLFAVLHVSSFVTKFIQACNVSIGFFKKLIDKVTSNQVFLLQVIAINEVMLMPIIIITVLTGGGNIFLPFVYYRFIFLRYSSARNPYSKMVFMHLRMSVDQLAANPKCPAMVGNLMLKMRDLVIRLCPQQ